MTSRAVASLLALLVAAGCGERSTEVELARDIEPIVVFASYGDPDYLPAFFRKFTDETGIRVTVRQRDPEQSVAELIDGQNPQPADVFLAATAADAWFAAENNGLRPLDRTRLEGLVPETLWDADGYWAAWSVRVPLVVFARDRVDLGLLDDWSVLGGERLNGKLCLSSSRNSINRTVIANLISELGRHDAELIVRGWVRNLALPPFDSESALLDALQRGACAAGIVSSQAVNAIDTDDSPFQMAIGVPAVTYPDVEAIGVARHARQPELAMDLVAWMLSEEQQARHSDAVFASVAFVAEAVAPAATAGWFGDEAEKLAERAGYR